MKIDGHAEKLLDIEAETLCDGSDCCLLCFDISNHKFAFLRMYGQFYLLQSNQDDFSVTYNVRGVQFTIEQWLATPEPTHLQATFASIRAHRCWLNKEEFIDFMVELKLAIKGQRPLLCLDLLGAPFKTTREAVCFALPFRLSDVSITQNA